MKGAGSSVLAAVTIHVEVGEVERCTVNIGLRLDGSGGGLRAPSLVCRCECERGRACEGVNVRVIVSVIVSVSM